jgi:hypothetical protein
MDIKYVPLSHCLTLYQLTFRYSIFDITEYKKILELFFNIIIIK